MKARNIALPALLLVTLVTGLIFRERMAIAFNMVKQRVSKKSVADRLAEFGPAARARLNPSFAQAGVRYPPGSVNMVVLKNEKLLQVYAGAKGQMHFIGSYPVQAASGGLGPKLREGDHQVPEGIYTIESLNPNSAYHVSLRLNYPNDFDQAQARKDGRTNLGSAIMIHGKAASIGCVAIGDRAAEEVFTLAADTGVKNLVVICSPVDFRTGASVPASAKLPAWSPELYAAIKVELSQLPSNPAK
jgi:hypothetical protein